MLLLLSQLPMTFQLNVGLVWKQNIARGTSNTQYSDCPIPFHLPLLPLIARRIANEPKFDKAGETDNQKEMGKRKSAREKGNIYMYKTGETSPQLLFREPGNGLYFAHLQERKGQRIWW